MHKWSLLFENFRQQWLYIPPNQLWRGSLQSWRLDSSKLSIMGSIVIDSCSFSYICYSKHLPGQHFKQLRYALHRNVCTYDKNHVNWQECTLICCFIFFYKGWITISIAVFGSPARSKKMLGDDDKILLLDWIVNCFSITKDGLS